MIKTEIKGFNQNNFTRGWALLTEDNKVKNICANCGTFKTCEKAHWDGEPCPAQTPLVKERYL